MIVAYASGQSDGRVTVDEATFPVSLVSKWKSSGKKVLVSVGGLNANWNVLFGSLTAISNFASSLKGIVSKWGLDGVNLKIQTVYAAPKNVSEGIKQLRASLNELRNNKLLTITAQCGTVYQGVSVPDPTLPNQYYNHLVYIIKTADAYIDYYQVKAYDDWYEYPGGSLEYLQNIYLNWRNFQGMSQWGSQPLSNF